MVIDKTRGILICTDWSTEFWWQKVQVFVHKRYYSGPGTKFFELSQGQEVQPIVRGVWAYLVDCGRQDPLQDDSVEPGRVYSAEEMDQKKVRTTSSRRRFMIWKLERE